MKKIMVTSRRAKLDGHAFGVFCFYFLKLGVFLRVRVFSLLFFWFGDFLFSVSESFFFFSPLTAYLAVWEWYKRSFCIWLV